LESAHAAMRRSRPLSASNAGACAPTCLTVTLPMRPVPTKPMWRGTCETIDGNACGDQSHVGTVLGPPDGRRGS
jgi:hypothetical protein